MSRSADGVAEGAGGSGPAAGAPRWGPREAFAVLVASELVLVIGGSLVLGLGGWDPQDIPVGGQFLATLPFWGFALFAARWVTTTYGNGPMVDLRLRVRPMDLVIGAVAGLGAQMVVVPLIYWPLLEWIDSDTRELEKVARRLGDSAHGVAGTVILVVLTCVGAPFVEEVLYRGLLLGSMERWNRAGALIVSAAVFAALHFEPLQFAGLFVFGLMLGAIVLWTRRLGPAIIAHAAFNATTVVSLIRHR